MGYAGPKAVSKVNMILKDKGCGLPAIKGLGNPLKKNHNSSGIYKKGCSYKRK